MTSAAQPAVGSEQPPNELPPAMQMVQMLAGFQVAQALYVVAKLDIATHLDRGALDRFAKLVR